MPPWVDTPSFFKSEILSAEDFSRTAEMLRMACSYAEHRGILVATENSLDGPMTLDLIESVNSPILRVLVDTLNPFLRGYVAILIEDVFPYMCDQIHVKDGLNGGCGNSLLGRGEGGFPKTTKLLCSLGFAGFVISENDYSKDAESRSEEDIDQIRRGFWLDSL